MGGRMGFGPVAPEHDEPLWHNEWEPRALALTLASGALGYWTLDESRNARECLPWDVYLTANYYRIWLTALEALLERHGEVSAEERAAGKALSPGQRTERCLKADAVAPVFAKGGPTDRTVPQPPAFAVGDQVRLRNMEPTTHTRLPAYVSGHQGIITARNGAHVYPDDNAHGAGENPQHLYTVCFEGAALWGVDAEAGLTVSVDAWEPYLERA